MEKIIKLIWDFRGISAEKTAEHHAIHLNEFASKQKLTVNKTGFEKINEMHTIAFIEVKEAEMINVRDALKPHRGEWA